MSSKRLLILGLDGLDPALLARWGDQLPTLRALQGVGLHGRMQGCRPPTLVPGWSCAASGRDPGMLGLYGPRLRRDWDYEELGVANNLEMRHPRLWEHVARAGEPYVLVGVPQTFPMIRPPRGTVITGPLTPNLSCPYTYPDELADELLEHFGPYAFDIDEAAILDPEDAVDQVRLMTAQRFGVVRHLLGSRLWRLCWMVDTGCWRMVQAVARYSERDHLAFEGQSSFGDALFDYYRLVDGQIGELLDVLDRRQVALWVVSLSGVACARGVFRLNQWLVDAGYLVLRKPASVQAPFDLAKVDWARTRAWADGGEVGHIFINRAEREPAGIVTDEQYEPLCAVVAEQLNNLTTADRTPLGIDVQRSPDLYGETRGVAPDLVVSVDGGRATVDTDVGLAAAWSTELGTADGGVIRTQQGAHVLAIADGPSGACDASLYDILPTALDLLGLPGARTGTGKSLLES